MRYSVIVWNNNGERFEFESGSERDALAMARQLRTPVNRTVKIGHCGDSIRHWSRTITAKRNHWAAHSTAECSR